MMKAIIHIEESLDLHFDNKGNLYEKKGSGEVAIKNPTENTTLWTITLDAKETKGTKGFQKQEIPHVTSKTSHVQAYDVDVESKFMIEEKIDTNFKRENPEEVDPSHDNLAYLTEQNTLFQITLKNDYEFDLENVVLLKNLPGVTIDSEILQPHAGNAEIKDFQVQWKIDKIPAQSSVTINILATLKAKQVQEVETGNITVTAEAQAQFSDLQPTMKAECDDVTLSVNVQESNSPGYWTITGAFLNKSEFDVQLQKVRVSTDTPIIEETNIDQNIESGFDEALWTMEKTLESAEYPQVSNELDYAVLFDITKHVTLTAERDSNYLPVVKVEVTKEFVPPMVPTYTRSDLKSETKIINDGSCRIGMIEIEETIPPFFEVNNVKAILDEQQVPLEYEILMKENQTDLSLKNPRTMKVNISELDLHPKGQLTVYTVGVIQKPIPNAEYDAHGILKAYAIHPSVPYKTNLVDTENKPPKLNIEYRQRSYKHDTSFKSLGSEEWEITIKIENNGKVPLENIIVFQPTPGAEYVSHTPAAVNTEAKNDGVEFRVSRIGLNETFVITLTVKSPGPIKRQDPSIKILD